MTDENKNNISTEEKKPESLLETADILPRDKRKAKKQKLAKADEVDAAVARSKIRSANKVKNKKRFKQIIILSVLGLFGWLGYFLFAPYKGTMAFGICKVFLELSVQFPQSLRLSGAEEMDASVRIWYTQVDSFGEYRMDQMQCYFRPDANGTSRLEKVTISRREYDPEKVKAFNKVIPIILKYPPDLTYPSPLPDDVQNLQFQTDRFRKPIL